MNPVLEIYTKAMESKQNGIKVMSIDYILKKFAEEGDFYRLASNSLVETHNASNR